MARRTVTLFAANDAPLARAGGRPGETSLWFSDVAPECSGHGYEYSHAPRRIVGFESRGVDLKRSEAGRMTNGSLGRWCVGGLQSSHLPRRVPLLKQGETRRRCAHLLRDTDQK